MEYTIRESDNPLMKTAISRVSPAVVHILCSYTLSDKRGKLHLFKREANGTIFSCIPEAEDHNGPFVSYILTAPQLFIELKHNLDIPGSFNIVDSPVNKIQVCLQTNKLYEGEVMACDLEMRIAVVKIKSDDPLPTATLTPFSDWISLSPFGLSESDAPFYQSPHPTKLIPGDEVTIVSCLFGEESYHPVVFYGLHSVDYIGPGFDSKPFLRIHCRKAKNGAPVINCEGGVIGVFFHLNRLAFFVPVNVVFKWWKQVMTYGEIRRPYMGIQIANLYTAGLKDLEPLVLDYNVCDGVLVEKVMLGSPAKSAKMHAKDVIYQCDGIAVRSFLEFIELLWDKIGEVVEVKGVRKQQHFACKVEIKAIKAKLLPESLAEYVLTRGIKTGILPRSLAENVVTREVKDKADVGYDSDAAEKLEERKKFFCDLSSVPTVEATNTGVLPVSSPENIVTRKKSTKKGKNKAKDKKKSKKDLAKRKGNAIFNAEVDSVAAENLERKKSRWDLSKCSTT